MAAGYIKLARCLLDSNYSLTALGWRDCGVNEVAKVLQIIFDSQQKPEEITEQLNRLYKYHPDTIAIDRADMERSCQNFDSDFCNCYLPNVGFDDYYCRVKQRERALSDESRNTPEYNKWRRSVFERDNYTCQKCGQYGGELNAHHVEHFAKNIDKRLDIENGITLCTNCHKKEHRKRGG